MSCIRSCCQIVLFCICLIVGARALDHLARMKQKLNSERKRVESDLKKEQVICGYY